MQYYPEAFAVCHQLQYNVIDPLTLFSSIGSMMKIKKEENRERNESTFNSLLLSPSCLHG